MKNNCYFHCNSTHDKSSTTEKGKKWAIWLKSQLLHVLCQLKKFKKNIFSSLQLKEIICADPLVNLEKHYGSTLPLLNPDKSLAALQLMSKKFSGESTRIRTVLTHGLKQLGLWQIYTHYAKIYSKTSVHNSYLMTFPSQNLGSYIN